MAQGKTFDFDNQPTMLGHPVGLFILFFTELWERFSYYGMRGILVLFLVAQTNADNPGFGWTEGRALELYGWYTMLVYVASIPGGLLADRLLGQKKSVMLGGLLLCAGHGILAIEAEWAFFTGLALIIAGVGCLKPNISTMVGGLYRQGDDRRDVGFTIFYIGINVGAFLASLLVGWVGVEYGWHYGFGLAGIGMFIGQIVYMSGQKYLKGVGDAPTKEETSAEANVFGELFKRRNAVLALALISALGVYLIVSGSIGYGLLAIFLAFAVGVSIIFYQDSNQVERDQLMVTFLSFLIIITFWGAFEQAGGLMNLYAEQKTDRMLGGFEVPAPWFQSLNPLYIILFGTPVGLFWLWWKRKGREASSLFKMAVGVIIMGWGFLFMSGASMQYEKLGESAMYWLVLAYLLHTIGELCASPVALSFITKLSPARYVSFMMGFYFAATGLGNKVAGALGEAAQSAGELEIFTGIAIFCTVIGLLVIALLKPLKRLTHGAEEQGEDTHFEEQEGYEVADIPEDESDAGPKRDGSVLDPPNQ
ncbi:MAG: MFS transporter [Bacteroidetes bacterium]|jgi:POT family proton-dependent oligopeptide transporter|nr:MFS transporter [Bacteroidota bacterium]